MSLIDILWPGHGLGYRQDPEDPTDKPIYTLVGASPEVPSCYSVDGSVVVKDQGKTGSCAGQAVSNALRLAYLADQKPCPDLSALFIYYNARRETFPVVVDSGVYLRNAIKSVQKLGVPEEKFWPFSYGKRNTQPDWNANRYAFAQRGMRGYFRIPAGREDTPKLVRAAIAAKCPVVAGWDIDKAFQNDKTEGVVDAITSNFIGGHAMVITAYRGDGTFTLLNSWGSYWREDGRVRVTSDFIRKGKDLWAVNV